MTDPHSYYFGDVSILWDEFGNKVIDHQNGAIRVRHLVIPNTENYKLVVERHDGGGVYTIIHELV